MLFPAVLPCLFPQLSLKKAVLVGFLMSLGRELIQYAAAIGVADIDDLILNTLGTLAGAGIYYGLLLNEAKQRWRDRYD